MVPCFSEDDYKKKKQIKAEVDGLKAEMETKEKELKHHIKEVFVLSQMTFCQIFSVCGLLFVYCWSFSAESCIITSSLP